MAKTKIFSAKFLHVLIFLLIPAILSAQDFTDSGQSFPGLYAGSAHWADIDGDNDLDLILTGLNTLMEPVTLIYENSASVLSEINHNLPGVYFGDAVPADYDNDGDIDILVIGLDEDQKSIMELWENESGTYVKDTNQDELTGLRFASAAWGDFNSDGLIDLITTGTDEFGDPKTILYKNVKEEGVSKYILNEETGQSFLNITKGSAAFGDYDNDGDLDLVLSGIDVSGFPNAAIYKNDPTGFYTNDNTNSAIIDKLSSGSLEWGDYDLDGYLDLLQTGYTSDWDAIIKLYENEHNGRLSEYTFTGIQDLSGSAIWADLDNDGDFDIAAAGKDKFSNHYGLVLERLSNSTFSQNTADFTALSNGALAAGDYNNDGKLDILISGVNTSGQYQTILYRNSTVVSSYTPTAPLSLESATVTNDKVILSWDKGSDSQTSDDVLTYNVRVGISGSPDLILSGKTTGKGNAGYQIDMTLNTQLSEGEYTWSVQTVNSQMVKSSWSTEQTFKVEQFVSSLQNIAGFQYSASAWGDYDGDGDPDLVLSGTDANGQNRTLLYINKEGSLEQDRTVNSELIKVNYGAFDWGDYDNDGDLDLAYTGFFVRESATSGIYKNENGVLTEQEGVFEAVGYASLDWGDYDSDGDLDLAVMGKTTAGPYSTKIYKNDDGTMTEDTGLSLLGYANGMLKWIDYDNDGDLDLIITGQTSNNDHKLRMYENDPAGTLTEDASNTNLPSFQSSTFELADLDTDGDLDLIISGWYNNTTAKTLVYLNAAGVFTEDETFQSNLHGIYGGSFAVGDYDNDGDPDLVITGYDLSGPSLKVYKNGTTTFTEEQLTILENSGVDFSSADLVDIDGDGDLELFTAGRFKIDETSYTASTIVYDNVNARSNPNTAPQAPTNLATLVSGSQVTFSWDAAVDFPLGDTKRENPFYQLRIGTTRGGNEIASGTIPADIGAYSAATSRIINGLSSSYYWSVRAVDNGLGVSDWAEEQYFRVDNTAPAVNSSSPTPNQQSTETDITITATFGEALDPSSVASDILKLYNGSEEISASSNTELSEDGKTISRLYVDLPYETELRAVVVSTITDLVGNRMEGDHSWIFKTAKVITAVQGGIILNNEGTVLLTVAPLSVSTDVEIPIVSASPANLPSGVTFANVAYRLGPDEEVSLSKPALLEITYNEAVLNSNKASLYKAAITENKLAVYRQDPNSLTTWERIGGTVDATLNKITVSIEKLGTFGLFEDLTDGSGSEAPEDLNISPRVFAPLGTGYLPQETGINFTLNKSASVTILVFNSSGRLVRRLLENEQLNYGPQTIIWDGKDGDGRVLPSGLYTVLVNSGGTKKLKTVAISNK